MSGWTERYETKAGKRRYRARYRVGGRVVSKSFARKLDAERWLAEQQVDRAKGTWAHPRAGKLPYGEWYARWRGNLPARRRSTMARNDSLAQVHILPYWSEWELAEISQSDVVGWVASLERKGLAAATVRECYGVFARSMRAAASAKLIGTTPCVDVPLPKIDRDEVRFLTAEQVDALADAIHPRYRALVLVMAYGGLRLGEALALTRDRVDLLHGTVRIEGGKTQAASRTLGLPRGVMAELEHHLERYSTSWVFPAPLGGRQSGNNFRNRFWRPAAAAAGIDPELTPHSLRHTAVSLWIAQGTTDPKVIAHRAGHVSVASILDLYGGLLPGHDAELVERLDEVYVRAANGGGEVVNLTPRPT